jgi:hypothetical protein
MHIRSCLGAIGICAVAQVAATPAIAQWVPGYEITGQTVRVETNGVINRVDFLPNGVARISSPSGATIVDATWTANQGELCLTTPKTADCFPYKSAFESGKSVWLTSKCKQVTKWTPEATNAPPQATPERG